MEVTLQQRNVRSYFFIPPPPPPQSTVGGARDPEIQAVTIFRELEPKSPPRNCRKAKDAKSPAGEKRPINKTLWDNTQSSPTSSRLSKRSPDSHPPLGPSQPAPSRLLVSLTGQQMIDRPLHQSLALLRGGTQAPAQSLVPPAR